MRKRSVVAVAAFGLALGSLPACAQAYSVQPSGTLVQESPEQTIPPEDQATTEQLGRLFQVMRLKQQVQSIRNLIPTMVEGQIREQSKALGSQSKLTTEQRAAMELISHKYLEKAINIYPVDEMIGDMTSIYQRYLTREDVDSMIAFYSSSAGQHLLDAQPKITKEYMPLVMTRVQERTRLLTAQMMKEAAAATQTPRSTAAPKQ
ncbi:MAG: DUF2059 domain-containing protein [Terracidiphilus sp.]